MNSLMEDVDYSSRDFSMSSPWDQFRPLQLTRAHVLWPLKRRDDGRVTYVTDAQGNALSNPRSLGVQCMQIINSNEWLLVRCMADTLPYDLWCSLLSEAIICGEIHAVQYLVSSWPENYLRVMDILSPEDLCDDYLTSLCEENGICLLDPLVLGILNLDKTSKLKIVDFTGFPKDRQISCEIARLPLLHLAPSERNVENVAKLVEGKLRIDKRHLGRYLENFSEMYHLYDQSVDHRNKLDEIVVITDCHLDSLDVAVGLTLQWQTPFRFMAQKVWSSFSPHNTLLMPGVSLTQINFSEMLQPRFITHLELRDMAIAAADVDLEHLVNALKSLPMLTALGLCRVLNFYPERFAPLRSNSSGGSSNANANNSYNSNPELRMRMLCAQFNKVLSDMEFLSKLDLSHCFLRGRLRSLLDGCTQPIAFLCLQDCRLIVRDFNFLQNWKALRSVEELNISMNDLSLLPDVPINVVNEKLFLSCFSVSFCGLTTDALVNLASECQNLEALKMLCAECIVPPANHQLMDLMHACSKIPNLQKLFILPSRFAFPGQDDVERERNEHHAYNVCYAVMETLGRKDIGLHRA